MRIAVTGAGGRLGRVIAGWLAEHGHDVLAIDRRTDGVPGDLEPRDIDVADPEAVAAAVKGADAVVHLAAIHNPALAAAQVVFANNTQATFGVLTGTARAGVPRVVYASSGASYGLSYAPRAVSPDYLPIDEKHPQRPADPYSLSKLTDEHIAAAAHRHGGPSMIGLRFPFVRDLEGLQAHARRLEREPHLGARQLWAYLEVTDLASAINHAISANGIGCEIIGLAAADTLSLTPTEQLVRDHHPTSELRSWLPGHTSLWSTAKAKRLLGWQPTVTWRTEDTT